MQRSWRRLITIMMQRETSLSELPFRGTKCQVCTGCGRCAGRYSVVSAQRLWDEKLPIPRAGRVRLVTADVGTTTIAMQLYDWDGGVETDFACVNPQVRFGADVLSRIRAAEDMSAAELMRREVTEKLEIGLEAFRMHLGPGETMRMVLAGNTVMIYLLLGFDPAGLGSAPFTAGHLEAAETQIGGVDCVTFPGLSAFVGGDIAAGMYACGMAEREELTLLIDLGTNGEMVLGNRNRRIACSTAAGPAFEGGVNRGVWGADMVHLLARLRQEHILDETGLLSDEYFEDGILIESVRVTQESIRAIQLAKGAIGAGIRILMREYGLEEDWQAVDRVVLAGGFGYYLRPQDAAVIGLLPPALVPKTAAGGNTALAGALRLGRLLWAQDAFGDTQKYRKELPRILGVSGTEVLNLAEHPDFQDLYIRNMYLE